MPKILNIRSDRDEIDYDFRNCIITFRLVGKEVKEVLRIPEARVKKNEWYDAKAQAKAILLGKKEQSQKARA
ncbi:MAG: hypothetical protein AAB556_01310 [Patescibacteria group bacterium]